jgi:hypothetical protein
MKSHDNEDEDRCSACPPREGEEGEGVVKPLTGYDLYLFHKAVVDKEAAEG